MTFSRKALVLILLKNLFNLYLSFRAEYFSSQQHLNSVCRSRRRGHWPLDHHHGPGGSSLCVPTTGHLTWMDSFTEGFVILFDVIRSHGTKRQRQQSGASPKTCLSRYWQPTSFLELISYEADFYEGPLSHSCWLTFAAAAADLTQIFQNSVTISWMWPVKCRL